KDEARKALEESWSLYPRVQEDSELAVIKWLEGKVASWLGEAEESQKLLDAARQSLLGQNRLVEAGLVSLDLAAIYTRARRPREIQVLIRDLKRQSQGKGAGPLAIELLQRFGRGDLIAPPNACSALYGAHLLKMARFRGLGAPPIPWV
ncbi:MAG TPA: hypothetical protein VE078_13735, partial [Thermoanaerobaculia bacterium]|nr:hypothetical protein [Thermoanaerobaculia bacterium]